MTQRLPGWDESARPQRGPAAYADPSASQVAEGQHLRLIHDMYRNGLAQVAHLLAEVEAGFADVGDLRAAVHDLGLDQAYQRLGSFCGQICRAVETHHRIEDAFLYPALRQADADGLGAVIGRLDDEHLVVHEVLEIFDAVLVRAARDPAVLPEVARTFRHLRTILESHFAYEEDQIGLALAVHGIRV